MSATDNGGPAFPVSTDCNDGHLGHQDGPSTWQFPGMTLRDYFAAHAPAMPPKLRELQKEAERAEHKDQSDFGRAATYEAMWRWAYADAMLKARQS